MPLTIEQLTAELTAQPELKKTILSSLKNDFTESLKAEGVILRSKDEETEFLKNYETNVIPTKVQAEIGAKIKAVHDQYDNDLLELLGEKKAPNEKTYDFMKRKLSELKAKKSGGNDDPVLADQIKELTAKLKERESYVAPDEVEKLKGKYFSEHVALRLTNSLDKKPIAVPAHITDENAKQQYIDQQRGFIRSAFMSKFTAKQDDKGNIVYYDGDKLLTDPKTAAPLTEEQLVDQHFAFYFVPAKAPAKGAGSGGAGGGGKEPDVNEANLKTKAEVIAHLKAKGMTPGGADFNKEYSRIIKDYAITEPGD
jgi:hypothetical protein